MSKRQSEKPTKPRAGRREMVAAKRAASAMATVEDSASTLGIGRNLAYELVNEGKVLSAMKLGRRWLIPRATLAKLVAGEITITV
jgi:excisionase family DNA binding protein